MFDETGASLRGTPITAFEDSQVSSNSENYFYYNTVTIENDMAYILALGTKSDNSVDDS